MNERYNEALAGLTEKNANSVRLDLGMPSAVLCSAGVQAKPMLLW